MGGGGWYYVPKVWTPSGGWWGAPKAWKANTAVAAAGIFLTCFGIFTVSASKERRPIPPAWHIPSQRWCKFAKVDDPSLP
mmetsp:Transcript_14890/g.21252  ORF Transcript_14890/g.21252 Transcript_14890/m.21252 type:complete len:80 (-) Transcript_14890:195-434(-)